MKPPRYVEPPRYHESLNWLEMMSLTGVITSSLAVMARLQSRMGMDLPMDADDQNALDIIAALTVLPFTLFALLLLVDGRCCKGRITECCNGRVLPATSRVMVNFFKAAAAFFGTVSKAATSLSSSSRRVLGRSFRFLPQPSVSITAAHPTSGAAAAAPEATITPLEQASIAWKQARDEQRIIGAPALVQRLRILNKFERTWLEREYMRLRRKSPLQGAEESAAAGSVALRVLNPAPDPPSLLPGFMDSPPLAPLDAKNRILRPNAQGGGGEAVLRYLSGDAATDGAALRMGFHPKPLINPLVVGKGGGGATAAQASSAAHGMDAGKPPAPRSRGPLSSAAPPEREASGGGADQRFTRYYNPLLAGGQRAGAAESPTCRPSPQARHAPPMAP